VAALFAGGHCLLTGVPGLAKTLIGALARQILDLKFSRIQFTPDLMPATSWGPRSWKRIAPPATVSSASCAGRFSPT